MSRHTEEFKEVYIETLILIYKCVSNTKKLTLTKLDGIVG